MQNYSFTLYYFVNKFIAFDLQTVNALNYLKESHGVIHRG